MAIKNQTSRGVSHTSLLSIRDGHTQKRNSIESSTLVDRLGLFNNQRRYHHGQKGAERHFT